MSARGVQLAAKVFEHMQQTRCELFAGDTQDILLARMLEKANDAVKDDFMRAVSMDGWPIRHQPKRALKPLVR